MKSPYMRLRAHLCVILLLGWICLPAEAASTLSIAQREPVPATVAAGTNVELAVQFAASVEAAQSAVVWVKLPDHGSASLVYPTGDHPDAPYPGQNDELAFVSATASGQFTASEIVVAGITVPAHSVYWSLGTVSTGSAFIVRTTLKAKAGTLQGTLLKTTAFAAASNATSVQSVERTATVTSTSAATLQNTLVAGIFPISGENFTQPGTANTLGFQLSNPAGSGKSTLYQTTVYEDLSALIPFIDDGGDGLDASDFVGISSGGTFQPNFTPPQGGGERSAIVWVIPSLVPGDSAEGTFRFHLKDETNLPAATTQYARSVAVESSQFARQTSSATVSYPVPETVVISTAIGERIRGTASLTSGQDNPSLSLENGESFEILLEATNGSAVALDDVVVFFKIPAASVFESAMLPAAASGSVFYATTGDSQFTPANPPPIDPSRAPENLDLDGGTFWQNLSASPPTNPQDVTWLAFHIPRLSSPFLSLEPPSAIQPEVTLQATLPDPCANASISSSGLVRAYRKTLSGGQTVDAGPAESQSETELTAILSTKPTISGSATFSPTFPSAGDEFEFRLALANSSAIGTADLPASELRLQWPSVLVNGVPTFFELLETTPAAIISGDPGLGDVTIDFGSLAKGAGRSFIARFKVPTGIVSGSAFQATATLTWPDDCQPGTFSASKTTSILSSPVISGRLNPIAAHTLPGGMIDYTATISNTGNGPATGTFAILPVSPKTVFVKAMCPADGPIIRFSNASYPALDNPSYPVTSSAYVLANFTAGVPSDNGTPGDPDDDFWTSPFGEATTTVAFPMDDLAFDLLPAPSGPRTIRWQLRNDEDTGAAQLSSALETLISAEISVFADGLLPAISNEQTTIIRNTASPEFVIFDGLDETSPALSDGQTSVIVFGTTSVGEPLSRTFTVKNTGTVNLSFASITLPTGFTETGSALAGTTIVPGFTAQIEVALDVDAAANRNGRIRFFRFVGDTNPFDFPISGAVEDPPGPEFEVVGPGAEITPDALGQFPGEIEFTLPVRNLDDAGAAPTSSASLTWPSISVNGVSQAAELISVSPSSIVSDFREFGFVDLDFGALAPGETKTLTARFRIPQGTRPQSFAVSASVSSNTSAGSASASGFAEALLVGNPAVSVTLPALAAKTPAGSEIDFAVRFQDAGDASMELFGVLVPVPAHIVMDRAFGPVAGSGIYFSDQPVPPLGSDPDAISDYVFSFSPGQPNDNGTPDDPVDDFWLSPFGESTTAFFFYLPGVLSSPSAPAELRWTGRNDDDPSATIQPSPNGTVISSQAILIATANERLGFLSNTVATAIGDNRAPVWNGYQITVKQNQPATVALAKLLARCSDPDGDPFTLALDSATSSEGADLDFDENGLIYTPPLDFTGPDGLDLILSDGEFLVTAHITVKVIPAGDSGAPSANMISIEMLGGQIVGVYVGIPGRSYHVQRSTDLIHWDPLVTVTASSDGSIRFTDSDPPAPSAFYRTTSTP